MIHPVMRAMQDALGQPWALSFRHRHAVQSLIAASLSGEDIGEARIAAAIGVDGKPPVSTRVGAATGRKGGAIAVVPICGICLYDFDWPGLAVGLRQLASTVNALAADDQVGTIILHVNSPGGTVAGLIEAGDAIFNAAQKKRVVAVVAPLAASAAFWLSAQTSEIIVAPSGDAGSVGVFQMHANLKGMLEQAGIEVEFIVSDISPFKTEGHPFGPLAEEARERFQAEVNEWGGLFVKALARGRNKTAAEIKANFGKGRLFSAKEAKAAGMVDRIEGPDEAMARLGVPVGAMGGRRHGEADAPEPAAAEPAPETETIPAPPAEGVGPDETAPIAQPGETVLTIDAKGADVRALERIAEAIAAVATETEAAAIAVAANHGDQPASPATVDLPFVETEHDARRRRLALKRH